MILPVHLLIIYIASSYHFSVSTTT